MIHLVQMILEIKYLIFGVKLHNQVMSAGEQIIEDVISAYDILIQIKKKNLKIKNL